MMYPPPVKAFNTVAAVCTLALVACDTASESGVEVIRYSGPTITEQTVRGLDWTAEVDTTIRYVVLELIEPDNIVQHRLVLQEVQGELPAFAGYSYRPETEYVSKFRFGTIEIQDFSLDGVVSGTFEGYLTRPIGAKSGSAFYVDLGNEAP